MIRVFFRTEDSYYVWCGMEYDNDFCYLSDYYENVDEELYLEKSTDYLMYNFWAYLNNTSG